MSHLRPIALLFVAGCAFGGCAEPDVPSDLGVQCGDLCDQANAAPTSFARVGRFAAPKPMVCQLFPDEHRVACNWLGSGDHPVAIGSANVTVKTEGQHARAMGVLDSSHRVASLPIPSDATSVRISARMTIDELSSTALGASSLHPATVETVLDDGSSIALIPAPFELWRLELLGFGTDTVAHLVSDSDDDEVDVAAGGRKTVDVAVAENAEDIPFTVDAGTEPVTGVITDPTILAVSDRGIDAATPEQIPRAGAGTIALSCTRSATDVRCTIPSGLGPYVGKIGVQAWSPSGDWRQFQVSPYFGGNLDVSEADEALSLRAFVELDDVGGLPYDVPSMFELETSLDVGESADLHLPVDLMHLTLGSTDGIETLIFDVPTLELGRTLEGWYEFQPARFSVTVGRQTLDTVLTIAVPAGQDTIRASLKHGVYPSETPVELRSGSWWLGPDGVTPGN